MNGKVRLGVLRAAPTILSIISIGGIVATAIEAARATPKAMELIQKDSRANHDGDPNAYTKSEAIQSAWKCYIPAALLGASTVMCVLGANILNKKQRTAMTGAYALINSSFQEYKRKNRELNGEEAHKTVMDAIAKEHCEDVVITAYGFCDNSNLDFGDRNPEDIRLFYDVFSKRYFDSTVDKVLQAEYHLNRSYMLSGAVTVDEFYKFLGLSPKENEDCIGWSTEDGIYWIDFDHSKTILEDGTNCYMIDMIFTPYLLDRE